MPKITDHPGVTLGKAKKVGYPLSLIWFHPLQRGVRVKRSIKTTDTARQLTCARFLSRLLHTPGDWKKKPEYVPQVLWDAWQGDLVEQIATDATNVLAAKSESLGQQRALSEMERIGLDGFGMGIDKFAETLAFKDTSEVRKIVYGALNPLAAELRETRHSANEAVKSGTTLSQENAQLREDNAVLHAQVENLKALLRKLNANFTQEYAPKPVDDAVRDYLHGTDKGTKAGERFQETLKPTLLRFTRWLPKGTMVAEISGDQVKKHLIELLTGKLVRKGRHAPTAKTVKKVARMINGFLSHQAAGAYDARIVKNWVKANCVSDDDEGFEHPYWLDQKNVDELLKQLPTYWKDAAELQWAGGFRPEELCNLMSSRVGFENDVRVEVARIKDGDRAIWKPKTKSSYGKVHIPDEFRPLLQRVLKPKAFLLFPDDSELHGGVKTRQADSFKRKNKIWRVKSFCIQYIEQLRLAAKAAGLNVERIDSRTLRRSCGKRVLLASNYNLAHAAAILRDTPAVVLQHYARLIPSDVVQPEKVTK